MISAAEYRHPEIDVVVLGEALHALSSIPDGSVDLIYIDPPFGTGKVRTRVEQCAPQRTLNEK